MYKLIQNNRKVLNSIFRKTLKSELVGLLILYEIEKENNFEKNKFGLHRLFLYKKTSTMV